MIYRHLVIRQCSKFSLVAAPIVTLISGLIFFSRLLTEVTSSAFHPSYLGYLFLLNLIKYVPQLLLISTIFGVFIAFRRFYLQHEMEAWFTVGLGVRHFLIPILSFALPSALFIALFSTIISPWAVRNLDLTEIAIRFDIDQESIPREKFIQAPGGNDVLYWGKDNNIFIGRGKGKSREVIFTNQIEVDKVNKIVKIHDGTFFKLTKVDGNYQVERTDFNLLQFSQSEAATKALSSRALSFNNLQWSNTTERAEIIWRLNFPIAALVLSFVALLLAQTSPRTRNKHSYFSILSIFLININIARYLKNLIEDDAINAFIAFFIPSVISLLLALLICHLSKTR